MSDVFRKLLAADLSVVTPQLRPSLSEALFEHLTRLCGPYQFQADSITAPTSSALDSFARGPVSSRSTPSSLARTGRDRSGRSMRI